MFETELDFFRAHQDELVAKYRGQILALQGQRVIGVYPTFFKACVETQKEHPLGTFALQPCEPGEEAFLPTAGDSGMFAFTAR